MKKTIILLGSALLISTAIIAQDATSTTSSTSTSSEESVLKSKKGDVILPEEGDWSIGIDAAPFFRYAGNMFNSNSSNTAPSWNGYTPNSGISLIGKMFKDNSTAYRAVISIRKHNMSETNQIRMAEAMPSPDLYFADPRQTVTDRHSMGYNGLVVGGGIEKRKGSTRLQGFYGGEVLLSFQGAVKHKYEYGNALTQNPAADQPDVDANGTYSTDWSGSTGVANLVTGTSTNGAGQLHIQQTAGVTTARALSSRTGSSWGFGLRGFIGAEYFFMPKMSIGGEFGWGLAFTKTGDTVTEYEAEGRINDSSEAAAIITEKSDGTRVFGIDNQNIVTAPNTLMNYLQPSGTLRLNFHF